MIWSKYITLADILKEYSEFYLFSYYFPELKLGKNKSPFRKDNRPSFLVWIWNNRIYSKDMKTGEIKSFWQLLAQKTEFLGRTQREIYSLIWEDLKGFKTIPRLHTPKLDIDTHYEPEIGTSELSLGVKRRSWKTYDLDYWKKFGISLKTLERFQVSPIEFIFLNGSVIKADKLSYVFKEEKDGIVTLKTYQPYSKHLKWLCNAYNKMGVWQGWTQLPKTGDIFILEKSLKDSMSVFENSHFPSASMQAENLMPKIQVVQELKKRFKKIYLLADNDFDKSENWGLIMGEKIAKFMDIPVIYFPDDKNYSDAIESGKDANKILLNLINGK